MTFEEYYGESYSVLKQTEQNLLNLIREYPTDLIGAYQGKKNAEEGSEEGTKKEPEELQPILYCKSRIKAPDSMIAKLKKQGLQTDSATALHKMHDAVGIRIVCSFLDDVYAAADWLCGRNELEVLEKKDYIAWPKPNGYRSLHLILRMKESAGPGIQAEIQIRTIAIDFWAALEHQMKYKHEVEHERLMREELKHCADEIMSVDMSMQAIRDFIQSENGCKK
ncbi:MAG: RelA/SpoT domain protein [Lachnospiraceae bacterium]|nr:RelA/SpoT domain protein [Lachnospiraceae bacterium]